MRRRAWLAIGLLVVVVLWPVACIGPGLEPPGGGDGLGNPMATPNSDPNVPAPGPEVRPPADVAGGDGDATPAPTEGTPDGSTKDDDDDAGVDDDAGE